MHLLSRHFSANVASQLSPLRKIVICSVLTMASQQALASQESVVQTNLADSGSVSSAAIVATSKPVSSAPKIELQKILNEVIFFNADFSQEIKDLTGQVIGTGTGTFSVLKPNYMYWLTKTPDESTIIADSESVWLYDPFIEQASVYDLSASIANTPILLLTTNDKPLWDKFTVTKVSELTYNIVAIDTNSQIKTLNLVFSQHDALRPQKQLASFSMEDASGQISTINLSNVDYANRPSDELFKFMLPEGTYLDDQR